MIPFMATRATCSFGSTSESVHGVVAWYVVVFVHLVTLFLTQHKIAITIHYNDVIMGAIASQITSLTTVYSTLYSDADQRKHQSSASLAFVRGIHRWPVNSPHKGPVTRKMLPFDDVIMCDQVMFKCIYGWFQVCAQPLRDVVTK